MTPNLWWQDEKYIYKGIMQTGETIPFYDIPALIAEAQRLGRERIEKAIHTINPNGLEGAVIKHLVLLTINTV